MPSQCWCTSKKADGEDISTEFELPGTDCAGRGAVKYRPKKFNYHIVELPSKACSHSKTDHLAVDSRRIPVICLSQRQPEEEKTGVSGRTGSADDAPEATKPLIDDQRPGQPGLGDSPWENYNVGFSNEYTTPEGYEDDVRLTMPVDPEFDDVLGLSPETRRNHEYGLNNGEPIARSGLQEFGGQDIDLLPMIPPSSAEPHGKQAKEHMHLPKSGRTQRWSQWAFDRWPFELSSLCLSLVCLGGVVLTLSMHKDRPLPRWPFSITINALISVLTTISKSALLVSVTAAIGQRKWTRLNKGGHPLYDLELYDEASRGPSGSVSLLLSTGWSDVASLGAAIMVFGLAMEPFMQQIASYESAPQVTGTSNISARVIFDTGANQSGYFFPYGFTQNPDSFRPLVTQSLYFDGNLSEPLSRNALQLRPQSPGSNVTFEIVETLAVCSEFADVTRHLSSPEQCASDNAQCCDPYEKDCSAKWMWSLSNQASTGWTTVGDRSTMSLVAAISGNPSLLRLYDKVSWDSSNNTHFDMAGIFEALAQGMTTAARKVDVSHSGNDALLDVEGIETKMTTLVRVQWAWISLPVVSQIAAVMFVWATLIASRRQDLPDWKSSTLALMVFGMRIASSVKHDGYKGRGL
ncbi:hypothetical protein BJ170DRAFT_715435 [Xylariales sp. AK1849]|nr:hypothetical protein BJ170DRAFT_715435 [Xylariales sp. AK1849]